MDREGGKSHFRDRKTKTYNFVCNERLLEKIEKRL